MPRQSAYAKSFAASSTRALLKPPADLDELEKQEFINIVLSASANHFLPSDAPLVAAYARAVVQERVANGELRASGYVTADGKVSPWLPIWQASIRATTTLARSLRLTVLSRLPTAKKEVEPVSYYERMTMEGRTDEPN